MFTIIKRSTTSAVAIALAIASAPATAQEVTLASGDGAVNLTGELLGIEGGAFILRTGMGDMRVAMDRVSCIGAACPIAERADADVLVGGSDTVGLGLMPLLLEGYSGQINAELAVSPTAVQDEILAEMIADQGFGDALPSILVNSTTSSNGFRELLANQIEISMASRRIRPAEARELRDAGAGNMVSVSREHILAADSLVMVTHPALPIESLTIGQVAAIYSGSIDNWSAVGGPNLPITVVDRPEGSGTRSVFEGRILGGETGADLPNKVIAVTNGDASDIVSQTEGAIAYVGFAFQRDANALDLVNECGITTTPDAFSAKTEEYALQRRLYLYSREDTLSEAGQNFIDFATSPAADTVIQKAGFTGFGIRLREQAMDSPRALALLNADASAFEGRYMRQMLAKMVDFDRLSTTFRFRTGSTQLDERGVIDMVRLIDFLETQPAGTEIALVGFTDDVGEFESNISLSEQRAAEVANQVRAAAGDRLPNIVISSVGFGEVSPSACNSSDDGRRINRRVEVWIKEPV